MPAALIVAAQLGVIAGVYIKTMDQNISLQTLVVQPLTFLGGTFYSVSTLPPAWSVLSHVNPVFYVVQVIRIGFIGHADLSAGVGAGGAVGDGDRADGAGRCSCSGPGGG